MSEPVIRDYLDKILLLEDRVGAKVGYHSFHPFSLPFAFRDPLALNNAARKIADFVGIKELVIVATTTHDHDRAGQIDLGNTRDAVFIEVAENIVDFPLCVVATMAHEISHRYLQVHGISCGAGPEFHYHNEILTDITAVFLGLGKPMLNGCTGERSYQQTRDGHVQTVTESRMVGYLDAEQLTFVYLLVCAMRKISPHEYEDALTREALNRLRECSSRYADGFFSEHFHQDGIWGELQSKSELMKSDARNKLNLLARKLNELEKGYLAHASNFLTKTTAKVETSGPQFPPIPYDPALKFILAVKGNLELSQAINDVVGCSNEAEGHIKMLTQLLTFADGKSAGVSAEVSRDAKTSKSRMDSWRKWLQRRRRSVTP